MRKLIVAGTIIFLLSICTSIYVTALTITSLGNGLYQINFDDGRVGIVSNIVYDRKTFTLTADVDVDGQKGLKMDDIIAIKEYGQTLKGATNKYDKTQIVIR